MKVRHRDGSRNFEKWGAWGGGGGGGGRCYASLFYLHDHTSKKGKIESTLLYSTFKLKK